MIKSSAEDSHVPDLTDGCATDALNEVCRSNSQKDLQGPCPRETGGIGGCSLQKRGKQPHAHPWVSINRHCYITSTQKAV